MASEALYYPYTTVHSIETLKAMVMYFDKIRIINPSETTIGQAGDITDTLSVLEDDGIVEYISPLELLMDYDTVISQCMINDVNDPDFQSVGQRREHPDAWEIYTAKIPSSLAESIFNKYLLTIPGLFNGQYPRPYREGPYYSSQLHEMRERLAYKISRYHDSRIVDLPFNVGESLMVNHALCACDKFKLTPLTDDQLHHDFLMYKFKKAQQIPLLKKMLVDYGYIKDTTVDLAAFEIIKESVPALLNADIYDLLDFWDYNKDALQRFKVEVGKIITEISTTMWDSDFYRKIIDVVYSRVKPAIQDVNNSTESATERISRILRKGARIAPLPFVVNAIPGCDPGLSLLISGGVVALSEYLESRMKSQAQNKNWCAYLIEARKKFIA